MAYQPPQIYSVFILSHQTAQKNGGVNCQLQIIRGFWNYLNNRRRECQPARYRRRFYIPAPRETGEKVHRMKLIEKWLTDNDIAYRTAKWGNPYYFNDDFCVSGLIVTFDFYLDPDASHKMTAFERYMRRKRTYVCKCYKYGCGWWFRVLTMSDDDRLEEHEKRVSDAMEAFWHAEHARRQQAQETA